MVCVCGEGGCCAALNADQLWALVMSHTVMSHEEGEGGVDQEERQGGQTDKGITQTHALTADVTTITCMTGTSTSFKSEKIFFFF